MVLNRRLFENALAITFIVARFIFCVYRAATQSIVHDEAFTYLRFLSGSWSDLFSQYDANHHILYSILARASVAVFGNSEWTLRLPSVAAGLAFSIGVWLLLRTLRSPAVRWAWFAAILLHPLLLDFSVAARGYGLSLALLVWAIWFLQRKVYAAVGLLLGLAVSANLTAAFPAIAMILVAAALSRSVKAFGQMSVPGIAAFGAICFYPLRLASRDHFYVGAATFADSMFSLVARSIRTSVTREGLFGTDSSARAIMTIVLPMICLSVVFALRKRPYSDWLLPAALAVSIAGIEIANHWLGVLYPADRTGLWLILLFLLAWGSAAGGEASFVLRGAHVVAAGVLAVQFASQIELGYFQVWAYDRNTRTIAQRIALLTEQRPANSVSVSVSEANFPAMEYYRMQLGMPALRPLVRRAGAPLEGFDYYVLTFPDSLKPEVKRLNVLFRDPVVGVVFAAEPAATGSGASHASP